MANNLSYMKKIFKRITKTTSKPYDYLIEQPLIFNNVEKHFGYVIEKKRFYEKQGYKLNLKEPKSFSEKIVWKKLFDRNPLLPIAADKYRVRYYIKELLGEELAEQILIPLVYVTDNPDDIPFNELPEEYIIKANNASNRNIMVTDNDVNREEIKKECKRWLNEPYNYFKHEWAYQTVPPKIIIEELITDETGKVPDDYKFFVFHGKCKIIQVVFDRFTNRAISLFGPDWTLLPVEYKLRQGPTVEKPSNYDRMFALAEKLGQNFDFVRVDLYTMGDKVYFGELTHYPFSGYARFVPQSFDFDLGENWIITPEYWKR